LRSTIGLNAAMVNFQPPSSDVPRGGCSFFRF